MTDVLHELWEAVSSLPVDRIVDPKTNVLEHDYIERHDVLNILDAFAAEHPGLVDTGTAFPCPASLGVCCLCGSPIRECMATIQEDWPDDPTPPFKGDWTCPACAKEAMSDTKSPKEDGTRCCANCRWIKSLEHRFYCSYRNPMQEVDPISNWCFGYGTGRYCDSPESQWEASDDR